LSRRTLALAVIVAALETAGAAALIATSNHDPHKVATLALALTAGVSFVVAGLVAVRRRPENRTGFYLAGVGYLWFLGGLSDANNQIAHTAGMVLSNLAFIPFAALVLGFPSGRLAPRPDRLLVRATVAVVALAPLQLVFAKRPPG